MTVPQHIIRLHHQNNFEKVYTGTTDYLRYISDEICGNVLDSIERRSLCQKSDTCLGGIRCRGVVPVVSYDDRISKGRWPRPVLSISTELHWWFSVYGTDWWCRVPSTCVKDRDNLRRDGFIKREGVKVRKRVKNHTLKVKVWVLYNVSNSYVVCLI